MFDTLTISDARPIRWLKRSFVAVGGALLVIGSIAAYRALVQVRSLDLKAPQLLASGSTVEVAVVSSGRTTIDVDVELIQGSHSEKLFRLHLRGNELAFFDPRPQNGSQAATLSKETLTRFQPGPARLRAVAIGREQFTRLPPPTIREMDVNIQ
jgi:hypothetical protein